MVGKWWSRKGEEIDGVVTEGNAIMFIECKWKDSVNAKEILEKLRRKSQLVVWNNEKRKEYFAVFAKSNNYTSSAAMIGVAITSILKLLR